MKKYLILAAALCMGFSLSVFADDQKPADTSAPAATTTEAPAADANAVTTDKADKKADKKTEKKAKKVKKTKKHAKKMKKDAAAAPATTDAPAPEATK